MEANRFTLEQEILECWNITSDIDTVLYMMDTSDKLNEDQIMNALIGMKTLYEAKFDKMFKTFEQLIHDGVIK